ASVPRHHAQPRDDVVRVDAVRHPPRRERLLAPGVGPARRYPQAGVARRDHSASRLSLWDRVGSRTRNALAAGLRALSPPLADGYYAELEEVLIAADVGPAMASRIASGMRSSAPRTKDEALDALVRVAAGLMSKQSRELNLAGKPACALLYGVNGAGKTTTAGKLAHRLREQGRNPLVVAADTYGAAGSGQVALWGRRGGGEHVGRARRGARGSVTVGG